MASNRLVGTVLLGLCCTVSQLTHAQNEAELNGPSYKESQDPRLSKNGPLDADPNVYVYTNEFAKRFQMPEEWVSGDLKGVDAVAFRVAPSPYKTCGWGGDPKSCKSNQARCEVDLYFDHKRNPLPWDERFPEIWVSRYAYSANFIPGLGHETRLPKRERDHFLTIYSPFVDPKGWKGLGWQSRYQGGSRSWSMMNSYDKEIFQGMSLVTLQVDCDKAITHVWLASDFLSAKEVPDGANSYQLSFEEWSDSKKKWVPHQGQILNRLLMLPPSWQNRVREATKESSDRTAESFAR